MTTEHKAEIALAYRAVSVCDSWWVKLCSESISWADINLFSCSLNNAIALIALSGQSPVTLQTLEGLTAETSTHGSFSKAWYREGSNNTLHLYKGPGPLGNEPYREVAASNALSCLNVYGYVKYDLVKAEDNPLTKYGGDCCRCELMTNENLAIVPAWEYESFLRRNEIDLIQYCCLNHLKEFSQMLVVDYLISNMDRHSGNWGFFRDMVTGVNKGLHWLYDHNISFLEEVLDKDDVRSSFLHSNMSIYEVAVKYVKTSGLQLIKKPTVEMFHCEAAYNSFIRRCSQLNIKYAER
jgi:hypothetical protein